MEIRILRNFLQIAREGNMSRAAEYLHISQPSLSRQMAELEEELGKKLFKRNSSGISLTDEGMLLRKRAIDVLEMVDKITDEFKALDNITGGNIHIGCAESYQIKYLARAIKRFKKYYPDLNYHLSSGNTEQVTERLNRGLLDIGVIAELPDTAKYNYLEISEFDGWGVLMRNDSHLADKETIVIDDILGLPLICSKQALIEDIPRWCGDKVDLLNITGTVNLFYNGSVFVKEGLGYMLTFDKLADTSEESELCFRPLEPKLETKMYIIWKKYQIFTPITELFLEDLKKNFGS